MKLFVALVVCINIQFWKCNNSNRWLSNDQKPWCCCHTRAIHSQEYPFLNRRLTTRTDDLSFTRFWRWTNHFTNLRSRENVRTFWIGGTDTQLSCPFTRMIFQIKAQIGPISSCAVRLLQLIGCQSATFHVCYNFRFWFKTKLDWTAQCGTEFLPIPIPMRKDWGYYICGEKKGLYGTYQI